jgi:hypothetical protein
VRRYSVIGARRNSVGLVGRRLAVRQARVRYSARHPREVVPTELISDEEMERNHHRVHIIGRDETGLVYPPTQLERTLQLYW